MGSAIVTKVGSVGAKKPGRSAPFFIASLRPIATTTGFAWETSVRVSMGQAEKIARQRQPIINRLHTASLGIVRTT